MKKRAKKSDGLSSVIKNVLSVFSENLFGNIMGGIKDKLFEFYEEVSASAEEKMDFYFHELKKSFVLMAYFMIALLLGSTIFVLGCCFLLYQYHQVSLGWSFLVAGFILLFAHTKIVSILLKR